MGLPDLRQNTVIWDGKRKGFFEAFYVQCNDPLRGMGWWFRYSILIPEKGRGQPYAALSAVQYDQSGASGPIAMKHIMPISHYRIQKDRFIVYLSDAFITNSHATGMIKHGDKTLRWDIQWMPSDSVFLHYPEFVYKMPFPRSKVASPNWSSRGGGFVRWNDNEYYLNDVLIHVGHVWGNSHTKRWAWTHSHGFDESQKVVFEGLWTPICGSFGVAVCWLKIAREIVKFTNVGNLWQLDSFLKDGTWKFSGKSPRFDIDGLISTDPAHIAGVTYHDPDGSRRYCYNTKIASAKMSVFRKTNNDKFELNAPLATGFEICVPKELKEFQILV